MMPTRFVFKLKILLSQGATTRRICLQHTNVKRSISLVVALTCNSKLFADYLHVNSDLIHNSWALNCDSNIFPVRLIHFHDEHRTRQRQQSVGFWSSIGRRLSRMLFLQNNLRNEIDGSICFASRCCFPCIFTPNLL